MRFFLALFFVWMQLLSQATLHAVAIGNDRQPEDEFLKQASEIEQQGAQFSAASDYEEAEKKYRQALDLFITNRADRTSKYAKLLRAHAEIQRHLFNFTQAQNEEERALSIEKTAMADANLAQPAVVPPTGSPTRGTTARGANVGGEKSSGPNINRPKPGGAKCAYGEARYSVHTAIGPMDCHLMHNGKGLVRVMNERDPQVQLVVNYPSLKCWALEDEAVNKGKIYDCKYMPCDAPPFMDETGATSVGATLLGKKVIDGHPCTGWRKDIQQGSHRFQTETWFATDINFPCQYTWAMKETPKNQVTWNLAVFTSTPRTMVFDLTGYKAAGIVSPLNPWLKWMSK